MKAVDLLDAQASLVRWWDSPIGRKYAEGFFRGSGPMRMGTTDLPGVEERHGGQAIALAYPLDHSSSYWVGKEMCSLIYALAGDENLPLTDYGPETMLSEYGFVVFETPIYGPDIHAELVQVRALQWMPIWEDSEGRHLAGYPRSGEIVGVAVATYTDLKLEAEDHRDTNLQLAVAELGDSFLRAMGNQFSLLNIAFLSFDDAPLTLLGKSHKDQVMGAEVRKQVAEAMGIGEDLPEPYVFHNARTGQMFGIDDYIKNNPHRLLLALFRVANQKLAGRVGHRANRPLLRRLKKFSFPSEVIEILLRKHLAPKSEGAGEDEPVLWSHRWVVNGHWRRQYYPSTNSHDWVYVDSYVKGPEEAPLILKDKVFKVIR